MPFSSVTAIPLGTGWPASTRGSWTREGFLAAPQPVSGAHRTSVFVCRSEGRQGRIPRSRRVVLRRDPEGGGRRSGALFCAGASGNRLVRPVTQWSPKVGGKTVSHTLSPEQVADYQSWFDNKRRLRALVHELGELGLSIVEADPRTPRRR